ncbi:MAG: hypothetical protein FD166_2748 [Bacteroidetes bacterium]|nr:MAG: hypothetical protein FD166_2748 [Bacteroidota bacterium]
MIISTSGNISNPVIRIKKFTHFTGFTGSDKHNYMKKFHLLLIGLLVFSQALSAQSGPKHRYLKPSNSKNPVSVIIDGKSKDYYFLSSKEPAVIRLNGPGKLRLLTRGQFVPGQAGKMKYEITYTVDGGAPKTFRSGDVARSINAAYINGTMGVPAQLADFEIILGPGQHSIEFKLNKSKSPVAVRYAFTPVKNRKKEWIAIHPLNSPETVELSTKESLVTYYRFTPEKPLKVELNGPTELQVLTRAEFQFKMRGTIHYRVQVRLDGKVINSYQLSSRRSETTEYKSDKSLVPGKGNEFVIAIPRGKHTVEFIPMDKDKSTILGRVMIPVKDVRIRK